MNQRKQTLNIFRKKGKINSFIERYCQIKPTFFFFGWIWSDYSMFVCHTEIQSSISSTLMCQHDAVVCRLQILECTIKQKQSLIPKALIYCIHFIKYFNLSISPEAGQQRHGIKIVIGNHKRLHQSTKPNICVLFLVVGPV